MENNMERAITQQLQEYKKKDYGKMEKELHG